MALTASDTIEIALTCDTDADEFDPSLGGEGLDGEPGWRGVGEGAPAMAETTAEVAHGFGLEPCLTWFVRADSHIAHFHGDPAYLLDRYRHFWDERLRARDEIAWHPHLYASRGGRFMRGVRDDEASQALESGHRAFVARMGPPASVRIGEAAMTNGIMAAVERLGLAIDSSAMPGRVRADATRRLDWGPTPDDPYYPDAADYRRPGARPRRILEMPMAMLPVRADYDPEPYRRYADLSFHPRAIGPGLTDLARKAPRVVTMTHPAGILPPASGRAHGLLSFSLDAYRENLGTLISAARDAGREVRFVTLREAAAPFLAASSARGIVDA